MMAAGTSSNDNRGDTVARTLTLLGQLLCWLGFHDFRVISRAFEFRAGAAVEKVKCRRCGLRITRQGEDASQHEEASRTRVDGNN